MQTDLGDLVNVELGLFGFAIVANGSFAGAEDYLATWTGALFDGKAGDSSGHVASSDFDGPGVFTAKQNVHIRQNRLEDTCERLLQLILQVVLGIDGNIYSVLHSET